MFKADGMERNEQSMKMQRYLEKKVQEEENAQNWSNLFVYNKSKFKVKKKWLFLIECFVEFWAVQTQI